MAKNLEICILLDFYGEMLTQKQRDLMDLYYNDDLSLGEIAEIEQITRQGVRDSIKRGETFLLELEDKLHLLQNFRRNQETFEEITRQMQDLYTFVAHYGGAKQKACCERILELANTRLKEDREA